MSTITLYRNQVMWMAQFSDPLIVELFDTDTLPTSFHATAPARTVLETIIRLNPSSKVILGEPRE